MSDKKITEKELQSPIRLKLEDSEINDIKSEICSILRKNNLSIRQARGILSLVSEELEDFRPWNHSITENSNVK